MWAQKGVVLSASIGWLAFVLSLGVNYFAGTYASAHASNSVTDLILSNIPTIDVDFLFIEGFGLFLFFLFLLMIYEPKRMPFMMKSAALFILIRSASITLTHIGPSPQQLILDQHGITQFINFTGDLFFSGHVGSAFLVALIFWREKILRYIFLTASVIFAVVVLVGHLHYSIDVFGAFFITYTIYHLATIFFKKDHALFLSVPPSSS